MKDRKIIIIKTLPDDDVLLLLYAHACQHSLAQLLMVAVHAGDFLWSVAASVSYVSVANAFNGLLTTLLRCS